MAFLDAWLWNVANYTHPFEPAVSNYGGQYNAADHWHVIVP